MAPPGIGFYVIGVAIVAALYYVFSGSQEHLHSNNNNNSSRRNRRSNDRYDPRNTWNSNTNKNLVPLFLAIIIIEDGVPINCGSLMNAQYAKIHGHLTNYELCLVHIFFMKNVSANGKNERDHALIADACIHRTAKFGMKQVLTT